MKARKPVPGTPLFKTAAQLQWGRAVEGAETE